MHRYYYVLSFLFPVLLSVTSPSRSRLRFRHARPRAFSREQISRIRSSVKIHCYNSHDHDGVVRVSTIYRGVQNGVAVVNSSQTVTPYEDGVTSIANLSENKVDVQADFTYPYLQALSKKTSVTNTDSHTAVSVRIHSFKSRFGSGFSRRLLNYRRRFVSAVWTRSSQAR